MTCNCTHHCETKEFFYETLKERDPEIARLIQKELWRQQDHIELIASENIVSEAVLQAQGSVLTNKYAEGYSGHRYYHGCEYIDGVETLAIERAKKLFNCAYANVQPNSGSQANQAVYMALLQPGDTIMGMSLDAGGHLTHGAKVSSSGKLYNSVQYGVTDKGIIDYDSLEKLAIEHKPKLIIAGGSAYARIIDFKRFRAIADKVGAYMMVDMAHFAGLVAGNQYPSPLPIADVVTTTTHKTLRGPRGGMILTNNPDIAKKINSAVFPGLQGGPLEHVIAGKAVAFGEALKPEFSEYAEQIIQNSKALEKALMERDVDMVTGGTDTHLILIDLRSKGLKGNEVCDSLARANIICNKNAVPNDPEKPSITSGLRVGTPAGTTRGFGIHEFEDIGDMIADIIDGIKLTNGENEVMENVVREKVLEMCHAFPIYPNK
ncbi:MAG: serine hydroxymethyltransferase [Alphaproteobacteria bacterium]|nr:serine hydroxymethyltransferase [Alphaproteobacteria bacterium]